MSFDSREMARRGRLGALTTLARYGPVAVNAPARARFIESFTEQARAVAVERGEQITDEEASRRGEFARRAWYLRLAQRSVAARRRSGRTPSADTAA